MEHVPEDRPETELEALRRHAEAMLRRSLEELEVAPLKDVQNLIHELQVNQTELKMQNHELRQAHDGDPE
jgi:hypothetical protein